MRQNMARRLISLLAVAVTAIATVPAHAATITNLFYGTVITADAFGDYTTLDIDKLFSNSKTTNLIGDSFALTVNTNTSAGGNNQPFFSINGGSYYYGTNPISSKLTINGKSYSGPYNSGSEMAYGGPGGSIDIQNFSYVNQRISNELDISLENILADDIGYNVKFPVMQASHGDFDTQFAFLQDGKGEVVVLQIDSVNALPVYATPEPSSLVMLGTGLLGLGGVLRRKLNA